MYRPSLLARVEEKGHLLRHRVDTRKVRPLAVIAPQAAERKIVLAGLALVLSRDYMINRNRWS